MGRSLYAGNSMLPNISPQLSARLDTQSRTIHILWGALLASVAVYGLVVFLVAQEATAVPEQLPLPRVAFPIVAIMNVATGMLLYRQFTSPDRIRAVVQEQRAGEDAALSDAERRLNRVPQLVFTSSIIRWALFESVAILGLVQAMTSHALEDFVPYGVVAIVLMAMTPPKLKQVTLSAAPLLPSSP